MAATTSQPLRVADADRLAAAEQLAAHTTAGRLNLAEYDQRVMAVWAARTRADLDALFTDLPTLAAQPASGRLPVTAVVAVLSALAVLAVAVIWLVTMAHPAAWPAGMVAACM